MTSSFKPLTPFSEAERAQLFGRQREVAELVSLLSGDRQCVLVTGEAGVGKTSLVRAGVMPLMTERGVRCQYLDAALTARPELLLDSARGLLIVDDVGAALDRGPRYAALWETLQRAMSSRNNKVLFVIDDADLPGLDALEESLGRIAARLRVEPFDEARAADVIERTVLAQGTYFESGLSAAIAADLAAAGPVSPSEVQLVGAAVIRERATKLAAYRAAGGAAALGWRFLERACAATGGRRAGQLLAVLAAAPRRTVVAAEAVARALGVSTDVVAQIGAGLEREQLVRAVDGGFRLSTPWLYERARAFTGRLTAERVAARLVLRRRLVRGLLWPGEWWQVQRFAGGLLPDEAALVARSGKTWLVAFLVALVALLATAAVRQLRTAHSYFVDEGTAPGAGVMVRRGVAVTTDAPLLVDTGFARSALGDQPLNGIRRGSATTAWWSDVRPALRPWPRAVVALLESGDLAPTIALANDDAGSARALALVGAVGRGGPAELALIEQALGKPASAAAAVRALLARLSRGSSVDELAARILASDKLPAELRLAVWSSVAALPAERVRPVVAVAARGWASAPTLLKMELARRIAADPALAVEAARAGAAAVEALDGLAAWSEPVLSAVVTADKMPADAAASALRLWWRAQWARGATADELGKSELGRVDWGARAPTGPLHAAALPLVYLRSPTVVDDVGRALKGSVVERAAAATVLGLLPTAPDTSKRLKSLLGDAVEVRRAAVRALPSLGKESLPLLGQALRTGGAEAERAVVETLGARIDRLGGSGAISLLVAAAHAPRPSTRKAAIEALGTTADGHPAARSALARLAKDRLPDVRAAAYEALGQLAVRMPKDGARDLVGAARGIGRDGDVETRLAAAHALAAVSAAAAARPMAELLGDADVRVRREAVAGWAQAGHDASSLAPLLRDRDESVAAAARAAACTHGLAGAAVDSALSGVTLHTGEAALAGCTAAPRLLARALADADPAVRRAALDAALVAPSIRTRLDARTLTPALADGDAAVRQSALRLLIALGDVPALRALSLGDGKEAIEALRALGSVGADPLVDARLRDAAQAGSERIRAAAIVALSSRAGADELLERATRDPSADVRLAAISALARRWSSRPRGELLLVLHDERNGPQRYAAALALSSGHVPPEPTLQSSATSDSAERLPAQIALHAAGSIDDLVAVLPLLLLGD